MGKIRSKGVVLEFSGAQRPFAKSRPLTVSELEIDPPGRGEVLVRIEAAGICHSDLSVVNGNRVRPTPMLLGHEAAGIVKELGEGVTSVGVGRRVIMTFLPRCGDCSACATNGRLPCTLGTEANTRGELMEGGTRLTRGGERIYHHLGVSAFAEYAVVDARSLVEVEDDVPPDIAAMLGCAVLTGGGAVLNVARPRPGESIAIVGLGGVGMAALLVAVACGVGDVIAVDTNPEKIRLANDLGATRSMTPEQIIEEGITASHVIECAGHPSAFELAFAMTALGGTTVTVGLPRADQISSVSPLTITSEARSIVGSYLGSSIPERDIPEFVKMWREGLLPLERLASSSIQLEDINEAMDALAEGRVLRQMIRCA